MQNVNFKYIDIDEIVSRVSSHPLLTGLNYEDYIRHVVDVLRIVNVPNSYIQKPKYVDLIDYKAAIPCDALGINTVDFVDEKENHTPLRLATDTTARIFNKRTDAQDRSDASRVTTYHLNNNMIITNYSKSGKLLVTYNSLACTDEGVPMIPDNVNLMKAIEEYIKVQAFRVMFDLGKVNGNSLNLAQQEYAWYIAKAQADFQGFLNDDDIESFLTDFKRLFIQNTTHKDRDLYGVERERRYKRR